MNFQQLRILHEAVRHNFNLTEVANALYTAQSGVSKHIKDLEDELGVELFMRRGKRLLGLTDPGKELMPMVERILLDTQNIKHLSEQFARQDEGRLAIATTHTQARYALPPVVTRFRQTFPKVYLELHECGPREIVAQLRAGQVGIGIATEALAGEEDLVSFPYYQWRHAPIAPFGRPLSGLEHLTLEAIADYPIITYYPGNTARARIDTVFERAGLTPDVVMSALDADVIKTYVELGLGVGIVAAMAYNPVRDAGLQLLEAPGLFESNTTCLALRRGQYLRDCALRFMMDCAPDLIAEQIKATVFPKAAMP